MTALSSRPQRNAPTPTASSAGLSGAAGDASAEKTLSRSLALLRAFAGDARPLTHAALMRRTGFSRASVSRLIATLVTLGYLSRAPDGVRYQIGLRSLRLGHRYLSASPIRALAQPIMQRCADTHGVAVAIAMGDGAQMLYVEHCKASRIATLRLGVGSMPPMELTAVGRAYLWAIGQAQREPVLADIKRRYGHEASSLIERIEAAFRGIETDGYCIAIGEYRPDTFGLAAPIYLGQPPVPMSLNFSAVSVVPNQRYLREVLAPALLRTANDLGAAFSQVDSYLF